MKAIILVAAAAVAAPAAAAVTTSSPAGFESRATATVAATPAQVYAMLVQPAKWWNGAHSYSGDAANISVDVRAGGCWCERLPEGGTIEHLRVVYARPGQALRLRGALGPLQAEGADGALTWTLKAVPGGTEITQIYVVGGFARPGLDKLAPNVDGVMTEALQRLAKSFSP